ncbi:MAG: hypothetical protein Q7U04_01545, partial [Bacteriovorax sp.]|nr:hypothetical protein [Bacteriovorax sp.]
KNSSLNIIKNDIQGRVLTRGTTPFLCQKTKHLFTAITGLPGRFYSLYSFLPAPSLVSAKVKWFF